MGKKDKTSGIYTLQEDPDDGGLTWTFPIWDRNTTGLTPRVALGANRG